jgi:hypothetical protein
VNGALTIGDYDPFTSSFLSTVNLKTTATQPTQGNIIAEQGGTINVYAASTQATPIQMAANQPKQSELFAAAGGTINFINNWSSGAAKQTISLPVTDNGTVNINDGIWDFNVPDSNNYAICVSSTGIFNINKTYIEPTVTWKGLAQDNGGTFNINTNCTLRGETSNDSAVFSYGSLSLNNFVMTVGVTTIGGNALGNNMTVNSKLNQHDSGAGELLRVAGNNEPEARKNKAFFHSFRPLLATTPTAPPRSRTFPK